MATTTAPQINVRLGGIDRSVDPWLLGDDVWYDSLNMHTVDGELRMYPNKYPHTAVKNQQPITAMVQVPTAGKCFCSLYAFAGPSVTLISDVNANVVTHLTTRLGSSSEYHRWATAILDGKLYFTDPANEVRYIDGSIVREWDGELPKARYLEPYYDHLLAANVTFRGAKFPRRLMWSDLYKVGNWEPKRKNEADHYDCDETIGLDAIMDEITGLRKLGDRIVLYTPWNIYIGGYVGLPRVMRIDPAIPGVGCDMRYGVVSLGRVHFFPSLLHKNFFSFNGEQVIPVGNKIAKYFFEDLSTDPELRQATWGYYNAKYKEVGWVYVSAAQNTLTFDKVVVMNTETGAWWPLTAENAHSFLEFRRPKLVTADMGGTADSFSSMTLSQAIEHRWGELRAGLTTPYGERLWGDGFGQVASEIEDTVTSIQRPAPYLVTPDFVYGDPQAVKEVSSMTIHATSPVLPPPYSNTLLSVSTRDGVRDTVTFTQLAQEWTPNLVEKRLSFPRQAGRIFRFKFQAKSLNATYVTSDTRRAGKVEIPTMYYARTENVIEGSTALKTAWVYPPAAGSVTCVLAGSGGGGGVKQLLTKSTYTFVPNANEKMMTGMINPKRLKKSYYGAIQSERLLVHFAEPQSGLRSVPLYVPNLGAEPDSYSGLTSSVKQTFHDELVRTVEAYLKVNNYRLDGYLTFYFSRPIAEGFGVLWSTWLAGAFTVTAIPANAWQIMVNFAFFTNTERPLQHGGAGSGAFFAFNRSVTLVSNKIIYSVAQPVDGVLDGNHLDGSDGGAAAVWFEEHNATYKAGGGAGSKYNSGTGILGAGAGGTVTDPGAGTVGKSSAGDSGTVESPSSGWPVTTKARGGRSWDEDGNQGAYRYGPTKGAQYGGGGSGGADTYFENLASTNGAIGYAKVAWRKDPVSGLLVSAGGFPNLLIRKRVDAGTVLTKVLTMQVVAPSGNFQEVIRAVGVFEMNTYTGGEAKSGSIYLGGSATLSDRLILRLTSSAGPVWYMNHSATPLDGCEEAWGESVITRTATPATYTLEAILPGTNTVWEPCDVNGIELPWYRYCDKLEAQSCSVLVDHRITATGIPKWVFAGFMPNVYAKAAEK